METQSQHTALLIFARTHRVDAQEKRWTHNYQRSVELGRFLNNKTQVLAEKSGLPVFLIDEKLQQGSSFGERLSNAFQFVFNHGYQHVIAIGNDCPALTHETIALANIKLHDGQNVLGPDFRKGAYLIGISRTAFAANCIKNVRWQSRYTLSDLIKCLPAVECLEAKSDFNSKEDIARIEISEEAQGVIQLIKKCLGLLNFTIQSILFFDPSKAVYSTKSLRAPPFSY